MPDFAVWALENGRDGPALRELAGLNSATRSNEEKLIDRAFRELDVQPMTREQAAKLLILSVCTQIVSGQIPPHKAAKSIVYKLSLPPNKPKDLLHSAQLVNYSPYSPQTAI